ncbi:Oxidoreductase [Enhygromyxa salina]|uniref:Oxidoreductase n=1 Tax=Enhygromyxa salina TaxID=215803 RepID=A0A0C2D0P1_9BACT|nr:aldo/keto reductase [Enhygromyxa salina]KIG16801.1 Oxidoreductase [Enhygromyxa salina]
MEYRKLGHSGLKVSTLCLGTMTFGEADETSFMHGVGANEATSFAIMDKSLDAGINFFDTADVYGNDGLTERVIGKWFTQAKRRDEVVLATKFRFRMGEGPNNTGASRRRIVKTVEDSLRRLATDRIDLYQIHMQDIDTPEQETLRALDDLVRAGKVLYIGASNYAAYRLTQSVMTSEHQGLERFIALQAQYSLVTRDIEREHVPACQAHQLGIIPWSPLAGGFLTGKYEKDGAAPAGSRLDKWKQRYAGFNTPRNWAILEAVKAVAAAHESTPAAVSLAWLLNKPAVTSVIFGARSVAQLDDNLKAAALELSEADMQQLDEASAFELGYPYGFMKDVQSRW